MSFGFHDIHFNHLFYAEKNHAMTSLIFYLHMMVYHIEVIIE